MRRLLFFLLSVLAAVGSQSATAQKIIVKTANLAVGQRVFLKLRQASNIHVRAGPHVEHATEVRVLYDLDYLMLLQGSGRKSSG